jgi:O-antigen ligase
MTYLEVFYKQGLLGLSVWFALFAYTFYLYLQVPRETREFGLAFFLASLFVFVETASNTFLTGSIGMAAVFIATASLLVLASEPAQPMRLQDWYGRRLIRFLGA